MQAVLFDLDGVIVDTAPFHFLAWLHVAEQLGISIDEAFNEELKGIDRRASLSRILSHGGVQLAESEFEAVMDQKNRYYLRLLEQLDGSYILPGIVPLLQELRAHKVRTGLASASLNAPLILERLGIDSYFDVIASPIGIAGKPAPDIFLRAAELLGVTAHKCVGVEDASAGMAAIKAAGMAAVGIGSAEQLAGADRVLAGTDELSYQCIYEVWQQCREAEASV